MTSARSTDSHLSLICPTSNMGHQVHQLVERCAPLDLNSVYCNILQCDHFSDTSCEAVTDSGELVGFVSGYLPPREKNKTLFVWQVAVDASQRGKNLGMRMIREILSRDFCHKVMFIETIVTETNKASCAMFEKLSSSLCKKEIQKKVIYEKDKHFGSKHDTEVLFKIGLIEG